MSESKQCSEATNIHSFLQNIPISFPETEQKVHDSPRIHSDIPPFNDSNSDDTQFEIQGGDLNSNDTSPVKDNIVSDHNGHHDNPEWQNKYIKQGGFVPYHQQGSNEKSQYQNKSASLNSTDATSFVDYFLAHDDLLQALDVYSRSVGETSVFPLEMAPALSTSHEKYFSSKDLCTTSSSMQTSEINMNQTNSIAMNYEQSHSGQRNDRPPQIKQCENETESLQQPRGKDRHGTIQPKSKAVAQRSEKRKPRTYSQAIPSQHCHICSRRPTETSPHAVCGNLLKGRCRKTICTKCFHQFRWDLKAAREAPPGTWECPHCRGECPQRAQCVIYNRTSDRRRMKLINHRKKKDQTRASKMRKDEVNSKASRKTESRAESPDSGTTTMNPLVTPNSCSSAEIMGRPSSSSKSAKKSLKSSGISKPVRTCGVSPYAQFVDMRDEITDSVISEGKLQNEWDESGLLATTEMSLLGLRPKVADFDERDEVELKREVGLLQDSILDTDGGNECEDITGIFCSMGYGGEEGKETRMEVDTDLDLLDIKESLESNNGESESQEKRIGWSADAVKYEETEAETFALNDAGFDLDSIG